MPVNHSNDILLAHIAALHYRYGLSQTEIAEKLGLSKMTISRNIKRAFDQGIIRVNIEDPFPEDRRTATRLHDFFPDVELTVVKDASVGAIGGAFAYRFGLDECRGSTIGVGIGSTVAAFAEQITPMHIGKAFVVQLIGGLPEAGYANPFTILNEIAGKLSATGIYYSTNALVETRERRDALLQTGGDPQAAPALWDSLDCAVFGVGRIARGNPHALLLHPRLVTEAEAEELLGSPAVADLLGHSIDESGNEVLTSISDRLASIPTDTLRRVPRRIALAGGREKTAAVLAALRSGLVTELVTDHLCAEGILTLLRT
jgi:DNA-binding transcriptional regulator LsrR (DeoR family)